MKMSAPLIPQEIYLLNLYSSEQYMSDLRNTWKLMIHVVENALARYMNGLALDYRSKPLPEQPDVVWGERVLPNFRATLQSLENAIIRLNSGNSAGLGAANAVLSDLKGVSDSWDGWMAKDELNEYAQYLNRASDMASNIAFTEDGAWPPLSLSTNYDTASRGPLALPNVLPHYAIDSSYTIRSGENVKQAGIYIPDEISSCAQFLSEQYHAPQAIIFLRMDTTFDPDTGEKFWEQPIYEKRACIWTRVINGPHKENTAITQNASELRSTRAGGACIETGFYFTPAKRFSRRLFSKGEIMPDCDSDYGETIWQWDKNQEES